MPWRYADLAVASTVPLSGLRETGAAADITITSGPVGRHGWSAVQTWSGDDGTPWLSIERGEAGYRLTFPELVCVVSADGARVTIDTHPPPAELEHLLLHQVLPLAVSRRGRLVLHACAVETPAGAVAFLGDSGAGKSTLAAAHCTRGFSLVADDALVIELAGAAAHAWPTADGLRLWADTVPVTGVAARDLGAPHGRKLRVPAALSTARVPLARIVLVGETTVHGITVSPMPAGAARMAILPHVFRLDVTDTGESRAIFDAVHALAGRVPVREVRYPDGLELLDGVVDAILDDLDAG